MVHVGVIWKKVTEKALEHSAGKSELTFFESVYRLTYATGLSLSDNGIVYKLYSASVKLMIILFVSSELWYLSGVLNNLDAVIDNINVTIIHLLVMYRYTNLVNCKHIYKKLAKSMEAAPLFDISSPGRKKLYEFWRKNNDKYFKRLLSLGTFTLIFWYFSPLFDDVEYNLPVGLRLPIEHRAPERYAVLYSIILLMFHYISYFVIVNDLIMQTYLIHMICQFAILSDCFENLVTDCYGSKVLNKNQFLLNEMFKQKYIQRLRDLVEQHKFLLNNATELKKILSSPMLCQLAASGALICLAGYQVIATVAANMGKFLESLMYLGYNLYGFYILCHWCDEIKIQSESISQAVYFSRWEDGVVSIPGVKARLKLVIMRASRPLVLTAGGLYDVSVASYSTLVKTSYSALTVLLRMRQEKHNRH